MNKNVFIWVGEFSYSLNWYAPLLRDLCTNKFKDCYNIIITFPNLEIMYSDFINEYHSLPLEILNTLKHPACHGQLNNGIKIPKNVIDYVKRMYPDATIHLPGSQDTMSNNPRGIYKYISPGYNTNIGIKNNLGNLGFQKNNTIVMLPKVRSIGGRGNQNWSLVNWQNLTKLIIDELDYNVVCFYIPDKLACGGSFNLNINSEKVHTVESPTLEEQLAYLKNTSFSIYGSTGANNIPFFCNTPTITFMAKNLSHRLHFEWQRKLTDNHKNNLIHPVENMSEFKVEHAFSLIKNYVKNL